MAARFGEGNVLFSKGAYDEAANSYEEVLKHKPTDMLARYNLGTAYLDRGRYDLAKASYEAVLRSIPEDPATLKNLGQALIGLDQRCAALVPLERSTVLDAKLMTDATIGEQLRVLRSECRTRGQ
jgi:tetratricopeptide (TPR) repeat protein